MCRIRRVLSWGTKNPGDIDTVPFLQLLGCMGKGCVVQLTGNHSNYDLIK